MVRDLDALYINFISGFELELGTARALRQGFHGPIYADLHSLFLAMPPDGLRQLRQLPAAHEWFACFDAIQLNEEEMHQLGEEPMAVAAAALGAGVVLLAVTLGPRGSVYFARPDFTGWGPLSAAAGVAGGPIRTALVPAPVVDVVDPTGCGDVFGATLCASLLAGLPPDPAVGAANRMAARNATLKGAGSLASLLGGHLARAGSRG
jgi:sugar/nucleoside kinase (ribokinase family)